MKCEGERGNNTTRENESICYDNHISMMDHVPLVLAGRGEQGPGLIICLGRCIWEPLLRVPAAACRGSAALLKPKPNLKALAQRVCQRGNNPGTLVLYCIQEHSIYYID